MIKEFAKAIHRSLFHLNSQTLKIEYSLIARQRLLD